MLSSLEYGRAYRLKHKDKLKEYHRKRWLETKANPEKYKKDLEQKRLGTKRYRHQNNQKLLAKKKERKQKAVEYLGGCCKKCGGVFPLPCYDFHHRDPDKKEFQLSTLIHGDQTKVKAELDKCDLLCANCHRLEHTRYFYE